MPDWFIVFENTTLCALVSTHKNTARARVHASAVPFIRAVKRAPGKTGLDL